MRFTNKSAVTKMQGIIIAVIVIVASIAAVTFYILYAPPEAEANVIKIGAPLPMTGEGMHVGEVIKIVLEMLVEETNENGGLLGKELELIVEDGKCISSEGLVAVERLIHYHQVDFMLGGVCSGVTLAAGPIVQEAGIPYICHGASNPQLQLGCGIGGWTWIFTQYPRDDERAMLYVKYMIEEEGDATFCLLSRDDDYGRALAESLEDNIDDMGGTVLSSDFFLFEEVEYRPVLTKIKGLEPDAFIITGSAESGRRILRQAYELGLRESVHNIYSTCCIVNEGVADEIGAEKLEGVIEQEAFMVTGSVAESINTKFKARAGEDFWGDPAMAYMALHILIQAIDTAGTTDREAVRNALVDLTWSFYGLMDASFDEYNHANYPVFLKQFENGEVQFLDMALP